MAPAVTYHIPFTMFELHAKNRFIITGIVSLAIWSLLLWNFFNGGIPSHHLLARQDLPEVSNIWGGLLLPLLTWLVLFRLSKRGASELGIAVFTSKMLFGFLAGLIPALSIAFLFTNQVQDVPGYILLLILFLGLFFPIYRVENILGFVIGLTFTFGAVLPTFISFILASLGLVLFRVVRPVLLFTARKTGLIRP